MNSRFAKKVSIDMEEIKIRRSIVKHSNIRLNRESRKPNDDLSGSWSKKDKTRHQAIKSRDLHGKSENNSPSRFISLE